MFTIKKHTTPYFFTVVCFNIIFRSHINNATKVTIECLPPYSLFIGRATIKEYAYLDINSELDSPFPLQHGLRHL